MQYYIEMLRYMRPDGSKVHQNFCTKYLEPVFGKDDSDGNYFLTIGPKNSPILFAAHSDTVHAVGGFQKLQVQGNMVRLHPKSQSNCLGADCTSGVWLILQMIKAKVPGRYAIFAGEELGCIGSRAFVTERFRDWTGLDYVISFDRKGYDSVITYQSSGRTCSDQFASDLAGILGLGMKPDSTGSYTDSNEFAYEVSECTNISVGYFGQHTAKEYQDLGFLANLALALIKADWSSLKAFRDPRAIDFRESKKTWRLDWSDYYDSEDLTLREICREYPDKIADWLDQNSIDAETLAIELGLEKKTGKDYYR